MSRTDERLVSILIPVYNGATFIEELLESIKSQSYENKELIIMDDCSEDSSYSICQEWCQSNSGYFSDVRVYRNDVNYGLSKNTEALFREAKGKYLFLADQDDIWKPEKIRIQTEYMETRPNCMICLSDRSIADERLNIKAESEFELNKYSIKAMNFDEFIKHRRHGCSANKMCIRNGNLSILEVPDGIFEQDLFIASMAVCCGTIDYIYKPLVLYRIHSSNISGNYSIQFAASALDCFLKLYYSKRKAYKRRYMDINIIRQEMNKRFGINTDIYNDSRFFADNREDPAFIDALKLTWSSYRNKTIGAWR
ncbi:MAG: glycosyltransferase [Lachnospiraceae bacterium]|nr:glycosyltransferase [Lachnospiraceae bacterium]